MSSKLPQLLLAAGIAFAVGGTLMVARHVKEGPQPAGHLPTVTEFSDGKPLPPFVLTGPQSRVDNTLLAGKWTFLFFGYTQCPDVCPTALTLMKDLKQKLAVPPAPTFQVVFVSVDPRRDTPALLKEYMAAFDPAFVGLTGDDAAIAPLARDLGVFYKRHDETDTKHYTVDHSAGIYLVDPRGRLAGLFSPPQEAAAMAADYRRISARSLP